MAAVQGQLVTDAELTGYNKSLGIGVNLGSAFPRL